MYCLDLVFTNDIIKTSINSHLVKIFLVAAAGFITRKIPTG